MNKVRGFVYFEDKNINEVRESFKDFSIPGLNFKLFNGLIRLKRKIELPGVLIDGEIDDKDKPNYSREIVGLLRKRVGLVEDCKNCDVSSAVGGEDYITHVKRGDLKGKYLAVRIWPPYYPDISYLYTCAFDLGELMNAQDVLLRGVEKIVYKDKEIDKRCFDLIGETDFDAKKKSIEDYLESKSLILEGYTIIDLMD